MDCIAVQCQSQKYGFFYQANLFLYYYTFTYIINILFYYSFSTILNVVAIIDFLKHWIYRCSILLYKKTTY